MLFYSAKGNDLSASLEENYNRILLTLQSC